ncbi:hypothetical protein HDU98_012107 [Podochytrium sp. JEL0797]|nr:hypothetical protein HDU98_012107 [Podochytrium sp. JEL0797]
MKLSLFLVCILQFGNYYAYDTPASLNVQLQDHLEISYADWQLCINLFFVLYSAPNMVLPFFSGKLTERFGVNRMLLLCSLVNTVGQVLVNLGLRSGNVALALVGRFVFGVGGECAGVAQAVFIAASCDGQTLLLATAMTVFFGKLGAVSNAFLSPLLEHYFGIEIALFGPTAAIPMIVSMSLLGICGTCLIPDSAGFFIEFLSLILFAAMHLTLGFTSLSPTIPFTFIGVVGAINQTVVYPFITHFVKRQERRLLHAVPAVKVNLLGYAFGVYICVQNIGLALVPLCVAWILKGAGGEERWVEVQVFFTGVCAVGAWGAGWLWWNERVEMK